MASNPIKTTKAFLAWAASLGYTHGDCLSCQQNFTYSEESVLLVKDRIGCYMAFHKECYREKEEESLKETRSSHAGRV